MTKIDFHVLLHPNQNRVSTQRALLENISLCPSLVMHTVKGIDRHIGEGRYIGFTQGKEKYCSFADDDDRVNTEVFSECLNILEGDPTIDAVVTSSLVTKNGKGFYKLHPYNKMRTGDVYTLSTARFIHPIIVFRRRSLNPYLYRLKGWPDLCEFSLIGSMLLDGLKFVHLNEVGYYWYRHGEGVRSLKIKPAKDSLEILAHLIQGPPIY